jgi:hypothetical protein
VRKSLSALILDHCYQPGNRNEGFERMRASATVVIAEICPKSVSNRDKTGPIGPFLPKNPIFLAKSGESGL